MRVELQGPWLTWDAHPAPNQVARPESRLLTEFVNLVEARDLVILEFARRWGPLQLCKHGLPWQVHSLHRHCGVEEVPGRPGWGRELLDYWCMHATGAMATLRVARKLQAGQLGEADDWRRIPGQGTRRYGAVTPRRDGPWLEDADGSLERDPRERARRARLDDGRRQRSSWGETLQDQHRSLRNAMDGWVVRAGVRPFFEWDDLEAERSRPSIRLGGWGLLGAVAVQLLFAVSQTRGLVICAGCARAYVPAERRPRADQRNYCPECGRKAAARDAARRYRLTEGYREARQRRSERARV